MFQSIKAFKPFLAVTHEISPITKLKQIAVSNLRLIILSIFSNHKLNIWGFLLSVILYRQHRSDNNHQLQPDTVMMLLLSKMESY